MSDLPARLVPVPTPETAEFWAGCARGELLLQHCVACGHLQFHPRVLCTACGATTLGWSKATGRGTVESHTVVRRAITAAYTPQLPYALVLVRLEEGPRLMSTLGGCALEDVRIGLPVVVAFEAWPEGVTMPVFRPAP